MALTKLLRVATPHTFSLVSALGIMSKGNDLGFRFTTRSSILPGARQAIVERSPHIARIIEIHRMRLLVCSITTIIAARV